MNKWLTFVFSIFSISLLSQSIGVSVSPVFFQVDSATNLELNFQYYGSTLEFDTILTVKKPQILAAVEVTTLFRRDSSIVKFDRYKINFPVKDGQTEFLDTRIYRLNPGNY
ncbi:MAG TPA: hypothetical protein VJ951_08365, partial [Bacteroidales bacterium]|nr:hypothetical protein [Bacteroidales bacterium]